MTAAAASLIIRAAVGIDTLKQGMDTAAGIALQGGKFAGKNFMEGLTPTRQDFNNVFDQLGSMMQKEIPQMMADAGALAATSFMNGLSALHAGDAQGVFDSIQGSMGGFVELTTEVGQSFAQLAGRWAPMLEGAIGALGQTMGTFVQVGGDYLQLIIEIGDKYSSLTRTLSESTIDMQQIAPLQGMVRDIMGSGAIDTFDDVATTIGRFARTMNLAGPELRAFTENYAALAEMIGSQNAVDIAGIMKAYNVPYEESADQLTKLGNITRGLGGDANRLIDAMIRSGPAMRSLGYDASSTALLFAGMNAEGLRGTKLVYGMGQLVDKIGDATQKGLFGTYLKDGEKEMGQLAGQTLTTADAFKILMGDVKNLMDMGTNQGRDAAYSLLSNYTTPQNAILMAELIQKQAITTPEALRAATESYTQDLGEVASETADLANQFSNFTQTFQAALAPLGLAFAEAIGGKMGELTQWMSDNQEQVQEWGLTVAEVVMTGFQHLGTFAARVMSYVGHTADVVSEAIWMVLQPVATGLKWVFDLLEHLPDFLGGAIFDDTKGLLDGFSNVLGEIHKADFSEGLDFVAGKIQESADKIPNAIESLRDVAAKQLRSQKIEAAFEVEKTGPGSTGFGFYGVEATREGEADPINHPNVTIRPENVQEVTTKLGELGIDLVYKQGTTMVDKVITHSQEATLMWQEWYKSQVTRKKETMGIPVQAVDRFGGIPDDLVDLLPKQGQPVQILANVAGVGTGTPQTYPGMPQAPVSSAPAYRSPYPVGSIAGSGAGSTAAPYAGPIAALPPGWSSFPSPAVLTDSGNVPSSPNSKRAAALIAQQFPEITEIGGSYLPWPAGPSVSGTHDAGLAIDVAIPNWQSPEGKALGKKIEAYIQAHADALGVRYTIFDNLITNAGGAPAPFNGGSDPSAGHYNHIDIQFNDGGSAALPAALPGPYAAASPAAPSAATPPPSPAAFPVPAPGAIPAPPSAPPGSLEPSAVARYIYASALASGYPPEEAVAFVAQALGESGIGPDGLWKAGVESPAVHGDASGTAKGVFQFTPDTWKDFGQGGNVYDLEDNIQAYMRLAQARDPRVGNIMDRLGQKVSVGGPANSANPDNANWNNYMQKAAALVGSAPLAPASVPGSAGLPAPAAPAAPAAPNSPEAQIIAEGIAQGMSNEQIAAGLAVYKAKPTSDVKQFITRLRSNTQAPGANPLTAAIDAMKWQPEYSAAGDLAKWAGDTKAAVQSVFDELRSQNWSAVHGGNLAAAVQPATGSSARPTADTRNQWWSTPADPRNQWWSKPVDSRVPAKPGSITGYSPKGSAYQNSSDKAADKARQERAAEHDRRAENFEKSRNLDWIPNVIGWVGDQFKASVDESTKWIEEGSKGTWDVLGGLKDSYDEWRGAWRARTNKGYYSVGGAVFGEGTATSDSIPAWLSNGEFVHNASAVAHYGTDFMHAVNSKKLPKFSDGGLAGFVDGGDLLDFGKGIWDGGADLVSGLDSAIKDPIGTVKGMAPLVGLGGDGAPGVGDSWLNLGKSAIAYDEWTSGQQAHAAGRNTFDIATAFLTGGYGAGAKGGAKAATLAVKPEVRVAEAAVAPPRISLSRNLPYTKGNIPFNPNHIYRGISVDDFSSVEGLFGKDGIMIGAGKGGTDRLSFSHGFPLDIYTDGIVKSNIMLEGKSSLIGDGAKASKPGQYGYVDQLELAKVLSGETPIRVWQRKAATGQSITDQHAWEAIFDSFPKFQGWAEGGAVFGEGTGTSDSIAAWLSNGEFVHTADAVAHYGTDFMHAVNGKRLPKFAPGGLVGDDQYANEPYIVAPNGVKIPQSLWDRRDIADPNTGRTSPVILGSTSPDNNPWLNPPKSMEDLEKAIDAVIAKQVQRNKSEKDGEKLASDYLEIQQQIAEVEQERAAAWNKLAPLQAQMDANKAAGIVTVDIALQKDYDSAVDSFNKLTNQIESLQGNLEGNTEAQNSNARERLSMDREGYELKSTATTYKSDKDAEALGNGLVKGIFEGLGFDGELFGKAFTEWGSWKLATGVAGFGLNLAQATGAIPAPGGSAGFGPGVGAGALFGAAQSALPGVASQLPQLSDPAVAPGSAASVTPALSQSQAPVSPLVQNYAGPPPGPQVSQINNFNGLDQGGVNRALENTNHGMATMAGVGVNPGP